MKKESKKYDVFVNNIAVAPTFKATSPEDAITKKAKTINKILKERIKKAKRIEILVGTTFTKKEFKQIAKKKNK